MLYDHTSLSSHSSLPGVHALESPVSRSSSRLFQMTCVQRRKYSRCHQIYHSVKMGCFGKTNLNPAPPPLQSSHWEPPTAVIPPPPAVMSCLSTTLRDPAPDDDDDIFKRQIASCRCPLMERGIPVAQGFVSRDQIFLTMSRSALLWVRSPWRLLEACQYLVSLCKDCESRMLRVYVVQQLQAVALELRIILYPAASSKDPKLHPAAIRLLGVKFDHHDLTLGEAIEGLLPFMESLLPLELLLLAETSSDQVEREADFPAAIQSMQCQESKIRMKSVLDLVLRINMALLRQPGDFTILSAAISGRAGKILQVRGDGL